MDMDEALRLIISRSEIAMSDAMRSLRSLRNVPEHLNQQRLERAIETAFRDPRAKFTPEERAELAILIRGTESDTRSLDIRVRVNAEEKERVKAMADGARLTVSDFIRDRIGL